MKTNPTELAQLQDKIISQKEFSVSEIEAYIKELNSFDKLFNPYLGFNGIPKSNLNIRQKLILATLHYMKGDLDNHLKLKRGADEILFSLSRNFIYMEGYSYFLYVKMAYDFYFTRVHFNHGGFVAPITIQTFIMAFSKFASPDRRLPFTDTAYTHTLENKVMMNYSNDDFSVVYIDETKTYIFVNHNRLLYKNCENLHINFEFGHFSIFHDGKWIVKHPFYPGYKIKSESKLKESWNNNIIDMGVRSRESNWRYLPFKPDLKVNVDKNVIEFGIGSAKRRMVIYPNQLVINDEGGVKSHFNLDPETQFDVVGNVKDMVGYHSDGYDVLQEHPRIELSGHNRGIIIRFE